VVIIKLGDYNDNEKLSALKQLKSLKGSGDTTEDKIKKMFNKKG
jgi:hypothetical protein